MINAWDDLHIRPALLVHDELVYIVPEECADTVLANLINLMSRTPACWPGGPPMNAEGRVADHFGK
jgi:hypothetical protein